MKLRKVLAAVFFAAVIILSLSATASAAEKKIHSAEKDDIIGKWYTVDNSGSFYFSKDGKVKITEGKDTETSKYTIKNGLLELDLKDGKARCAAIMNDGFLEIKNIGNDKFVPYKNDLSADKYFALMGEKETPLILSKEKPVPAEQKKMLGAWVSGIRSAELPDGYEELSLMIISKDGIIMLPAYMGGKPASMFYKKGKLTYGGGSMGMAYTSEDICYICGDKVFSALGDDIMVLEKYKAKKLTKKVIEAAVKNGKNITYYKDGKSYVPKKKITVSGLTDKSVTLTMDGEKIKYRYYYTGNRIYCVNDNGSVTLECK